ncbi:cisplatin damage response ATP-dependent DNA ligase [Aurantimonas sp. VKM B-3413]|uniref:cisplatin damage response ATP-dependent DNA ligase n=1 Tax=Aurantimonas sp. VKM B-3413 TaxID=2779401 RepID=UPI001E2AB373|nr:cisplatin damage response ATP-dependent DNA ligase [Aurantimonas sp. VKM B-3413]MCB8839508.1 cisplatin damage response ATP-dependent DNA ligase [Aurantimonas sp. VKM B-3413]
MKPFADLLDRLVLTPSRNGKLKLMADFFAAVPDPERGHALAAITGDLDIASVKPAMLRALMAERMDEVLFGYSYDYVGDLAETIALVWPERAQDAGRHAERAARPGAASSRGALPEPTLDEIVTRLNAATRQQGPKLVEAWLDRLDASGRYALLKLVTGAMRIGVSSRLAKQALADFGQKDIAEIEELWHGLTPPYGDLFAWLEDRADKPISAAAAPFRPVMLSQPLEEPDYGRIDPETYAAEWKWDGIRVQASAERGVRRLYSRTGDDISGAFPDLLDFMTYDGVLDGELLVARATPKGGKPEVDTASDCADDIVVGTFSDLQQRLNRKTVSAAVLKTYPVFLRAYDLLQDGTEDLRALPFAQRRERLSAFVTKLEPTRFDISPFVSFETFQDLERLRAEPPHPVIEGLMLKRWDSPYVPGRPKGPWFKWKQDPHLIDAVLMYAQRGHGKRSSFYSDYTFGVWTGPEDAPELVPVGKAYFGFTDEELKQLDKYIRDNTVERFGPVRSVRAEPDHGLVIEVAFEGLARSSRHKSGVAMRFPRVSRLRWDKPAFEADRLETLQAMLPE